MNFFGQISKIHRFSMFSSKSSSENNTGFWGCKKVVPLMYNTQMNDINDELRGMSGICTPNLLIT